jgi:hypothetical protein
VDDGCLTVEQATKMFEAMRMVLVKKRTRAQIERNREKKGIIE